MTKRAMMFFVCVSLLLATGGVINVISTNAVSNNGLSNHRWEPTSAAGSNWVQGWNEERTQNWVASWGAGAWNAPVHLTPPNGAATLDLVLNWDAFHNRFVFAMLDNNQGTNHAVWYGFSNDPSGGSWQFCPSAVLPASVGWDYPSVAADSTGRVMVGAVSTSAAYFTILSPDGSCSGFQNATARQVPAGNAYLSRLVAASNSFELFVPTLSGSSFVPTAITRWESSDAVNWSSPQSWPIPWPAQNNSLGTYSNSCPNPNQPCNCPIGQQQPPCGPIFYSPIPDAKGFTNGLWIVSFGINNGGFNNIMICTSDRGCGIVNAGPDDQFLQGVSVSGDGGYWVSYYTYHATAPSPSALTLPLITQAIYFPPGGAGIGATTNSGIDPKSWISANNLSQARCPLQFVNCFAAGDFQHIASNSFAASSTPFIEQSALTTTLFQSFVQDPPGVPNVPNFKPNFIPITSAAELQAIGQPLPPATWGVPPVGR